MSCSCTASKYCRTATHLANVEDEAYGYMVDSGRVERDVISYNYAHKARRQHRDKALKRGDYAEKV